MNIGIDISQIAFKGTGVGRYTSNLVRALLDDTTNTYTFFYSSLRQKIDKDIKNDIFHSQHILKEYPIPPTLLNVMWNKLHILPFETFTGPLDVYISSDWTQAPSKSQKKVTIIHDLVPYLYPETSTEKTRVMFNKKATSVSNALPNVSPNIVATHKKRLEWVKKECGQIIADSESTADDIHSILGITRSKISVVYPYVETVRPSGQDVQRTLKKYKLMKPFILTVGKLEPRKNIPRLIEAFNEANIDNLDLVISGAEGWGNKARQIPELGNIRFLGYVPEVDLQALYSAAEFFVYPSLYEGFGYPIVESMLAGCAVATSNVSSMAELAQDSGVLFNPKSVEDIVETMLTLHSNKNLRESLIKKGLERAKLFNKERFRKEFLATLSL